MVLTCVIDQQLCQYVKEISNVVSENTKCVCVYMHVFLGILIYLLV